MFTYTEEEIRRCKKSIPGGDITKQEKFLSVMYRSMAILFCLYSIIVYTPIIKLTPTFCLPIILVALFVKDDVVITIFGKKIKIFRPYHAAVVKEIDIGYSYAKITLMVYLTSVDDNPIEKIENIDPYLLSVIVHKGETYIRHQKTSDYYRIFYLPYLKKGMEEYVKIYK